MHTKNEFTQKLTLNKVSSAVFLGILYFLKINFILTRRIEYQWHPLLPTTH